MRGRSTAPPRGEARAGPDRPGRPYAAGVRIAFGTDERTDVTDRIKAALAERGHDVVVVGEGDPWPDVGPAASARPWPRGDADRGVVCCWTGTGVSMAANKVPGRAGRAVHRRRDRGRAPAAGTTPTCSPSACA